MDGRCPHCGTAGGVGQPCAERVCTGLGYHAVPVEYCPKQQPGELDRDQLIGRRIDEYLVVGKLGEGGFGAVYLTLQLPVLMKTALKLLKSLATADGDRRLLIEKFTNEARALALLSHPNIVRLVKFGAYQSIPYIVMEFVEGGRNLKQLILERALASSPFQLSEVLGIMRQLANALGAAHAKGIIHRDVKPENIMLQQVEGEPLFVRVLDFGLAKMVAGGSETTMIQGTPNYMAPEQFAGRNIGPWTDLYAAGIILFELLTGRRVFENVSSHQALARKLDPAFDPLGAIADVELPASAAAFVRCAVSADPDHRLRSTHAFLDGLEQLFADLARQGFTCSFTPLRPTAPRTTGLQFEEEATGLASDAAQSETVLADIDAASWNQGGAHLPHSSVLAGTAAPLPSTRLERPTPPHRARWRRPLLMAVAAVAAAAALAGSARLAGWWGGEPPPARLTLITDPPGAELWRDEQNLGTTPLTVELPPAAYSLSLRKEGFREMTLQRTLAAGASDSVELLLERIEFRINGITSGKQERPWAAALPDGGFVVAWASAHRPGAASDVFLRRFSPEWNPLAEEAMVNQHDRDLQSDPALAVFSDGRFAVVWQSLLQDGDGWGAYGRLLDREGRPSGPEFQINQESRGNQEAVRAAVLNTGELVVVWQGDQGQGDARGIFLRLFDGDGRPVGGENPVNSFRPDEQKWPAVASFERGGCVVVWESKGQDGDGYGVFARRFGPPQDGRLPPLDGEEFQVNATVAGWQRWPTVGAAADGRFVVAWTGYDQDGDGTGVFGRLFGADGRAATGEFQVNLFTVANQWVPTVATFRDGRFVVAWMSEGQEGPGYGAFGRLYQSDGTAAGDEIKIHSLSGNEQRIRSVAAVGPRNFLAVWENSGPHSEALDIFGRVLEVGR